eukprot:TRINITY_DN39692_c0_g1_i1.p1 TRINITY_DN39692_c0_g1~~TRINITY_DN39692_c0_g1_i1.p1  ORF type:complete len:542 (-),score=93.68 TRINITY_DN39692_c0_g1_i1:139-1764(-)
MVGLYGSTGAAALIPLVFAHSATTVHLQPQPGLSEQLSAALPQRLTRRGLEASAHAVAAQAFLGSAADVAAAGSQEGRRAATASRSVCSRAAELAASPERRYRATSCGLERGRVPFSGEAFFYSEAIKTAEACAALCAGTALQGCEAFSFCRKMDPSTGAISRTCMLMTEVNETAGDYSAVPGGCDSGRPCASRCEDNDIEVPSLFMQAPGTTCADLLAANGMPNCWASLNDAGDDLAADLRLVQAICPATCFGCAAEPSGEHTEAAALAVASAAAELEEPCQYEKGYVYGADDIGNMFLWRLVGTSDVCASFCASTVGCLGWTYYKQHAANFSRGDCVLHNRSDAMVGSSRRLDECCDSGFPCTARCVNHEVYIMALMYVQNMSTIRTCEEYVSMSSVHYGTSVCRDMPIGDLVEGVCPLSCYVRSREFGKSLAALEDGAAAVAPVAGAASQGATLPDATVLTGVSTDRHSGSNTVESNVASLRNEDVILGQSSELGEHDEQSEENATVRRQAVSSAQAKTRRCGSAVVFIVASAMGGYF